MEEAGDGLAGVLDGGAGVAALLMDGAGVAEVLDPEGTHGVEDLREQRRGGVRVHVDALHALFYVFRRGERFMRMAGDLAEEVVGRFGCGCGRAVERRT